MKYTLVIMIYIESGGIQALPACLTYGGGGFVGVGGWARRLV